MAPTSNKEKAFIPGKSRGITAGSGYVVYNRSSPNPYWETIRWTEAIDIYNMRQSLGDVASSAQSAAASLEALANAEEQKEIQAIEQSTGVKYSFNGDNKVKDFVKKYNEILVGAKQFENATRMLKDAIEYSQKEGKKDKHALGPGLGALVVDYVRDELGNFLFNYVNDYTKTYGDFSQVSESQIKDVIINNIDGIIDRALDRVFNKSDATKNMDKDSLARSMRGDSKDYEFFQDAFNSFSQISQPFIEVIKEKLNIEGIIKTIYNSRQSIEGYRKVPDKNHTTYGIKTKIKNTRRETLGGEGGIISQFLTSLKKQAQAAADGGLAGTFNSQKMKNDNFLLFGGTVELSILENLTNDLINIVPNSLNNAVEIFENYYKEYLSKLDGLIIEYSNEKLYSMGNTFKGFSGGESRKITDLKMLDRYGLNYTNVATVLINTINGAVLDYDGNIEEIVTNKIAEIVAYTLFDDWVTIGSSGSGAMAIHTLSLEGIQIPLSVMLRALSEAMYAYGKTGAEGVSGIVSVKLNKPGGVLYDDSSQYPGAEGGMSKEIVAKAWETQKDKSIADTRFNIIFLKNFRNIVSEWINF